MHAFRNRDTDHVFLISLTYMENPRMMSVFSVGQAPDAAIHKHNDAFDASIWHTLESLGGLKRFS